MRRPHFGRSSKTGGEDGDKELNPRLKRSGVIDCSVKAKSRCPPPENPLAAPLICRFPSKTRTENAHETVLQGPFRTLQGRNLQIWFLLFWGTSIATQRKKLQLTLTWTDDEQLDVSDSSATSACLFIRPFSFHDLHGPFSCLCCHGAYRISAWVRHTPAFRQNGVF